MSLKINLQQFWQFLLANTAISAILLFTLLVSATTVTAQNISTDNNGKMEGFKPDESSNVTAINSCNLDIKYPKKVAGQEVFTMIEDKTELAKNKNLSLGWSSGPLAYQHFIFNDNIENPNVDYNYTFVCYDFELIKSEVLNVENILVSFTTFAGLKYEDQYKSELGKRLKREYESKKLSKVEFQNLTKWELGKYDFDYIFLHTAKPISELGENNENFVASFLELKYKDKVYFFSFYPYNYNTESNKRDSLDSKLTQNPYQLFNLEFSSQVKSQYSNDQNIYNFSSTGDNGQLFLLNSVSLIINYGNYLLLGILFIIILFSAYLSFYLKKSGKFVTNSNFKLFNFLTTLNLFVLTVILSPLSFALDQFQYQNLSAFQTGLFFAPLTLWLVFEFLVLLVWVIKNLIQKKFKTTILYLVFTIIMFSPVLVMIMSLGLSNLFFNTINDAIFNIYIFILTISLLIFHFLTLPGENEKLGTVLNF